MSDNVPPRPAELVLGALGADTDFCDAVLGDLAEEFAIRAAWDGPVVARRWYYRESMRVAPHLLRNWLGSLRRGDIKYFANVAALSSVCTLTLDVFAVAFLYGLSGHLGAPHGAVARFWEHPVRSAGFPALMLSWTLGFGLLAGYLAARLGRRAPVSSALFLGAGWGVAFVGINVLLIGLRGFPGPMPFWFRAMNATVLVGAMVAGGVLRACTARSVSIAQNSR